MVTRNHRSGFQSASRRNLTGRSDSRSEERFPENDAVAVEQNDVVLAAIDDLLAVVFESLLDAVDDALENDRLRGTISRTTGGGQRLQQRRRLRAAELHAAR